MICPYKTGAVFFRSARLTAPPSSTTGRPISQSSSRRTRLLCTGRRGAENPLGNSSRIPRMASTRPSARPGPQVLLGPGECLGRPAPAGSRVRREKRERVGKRAAPGELGLQVGKGHGEKWGHAGAGDSPGRQDHGDARDRPAREGHVGQGLIPACVAKASMIGGPAITGANRGCISKAFRALPSPFSVFGQPDIAIRHLRTERDRGEASRPS